MKFYQDTICAIITPPGSGAINVIRVSGEEAIHLCDKIFVGKRKLSEIKKNSLIYGKIIDKTDDVVMSVFKKPNSYTGDNSVEISCHGNPLIARKIMELLQTHGARFAEPGEFTKRAFLNGKIDLIQAEAVAEIIHSRSDNALKGARTQLDGLLSGKLTDVKNELIETMGLIELELDFSEEDLEFINKTKLAEKVENIIKTLSHLINSFQTGRLIFDGINVAIIGKPNVGKSSLLNSLLKEERAIVSNIPGTTRDIIREEFYLNGTRFRLFDTAGIRTSEDAIEEEGVRRAYELINNADIIIQMSDPSTFPEDKLYENDLLKGKYIVKVLNKSDLLKEDISDGKYINLSIKTGNGMNLLFDKLIKFSEEKGVYTENSSIISNLRQKNCLETAKHSLEKVVCSLKENYSGEFVVVDIRIAINSLKELIGEVTTDDIMNAIFSKFCIGK